MRLLVDEYQKQGGKKEILEKFYPTRYGQTRAIRYDKDKIVEFYNYMTCVQPDGIRAAISAFIPGKSPKTDYENMMYIDFIFLDADGDDDYIDDCDNFVDTLTRTVLKRNAGAAFNNKNTVMVYDNGVLCPPDPSCTNYLKRK
ncbi:MAG: hypothetical protein K2Q21_01120 [Chitinophagaceae bacterium]|nr:hypothetical protein [Chitinophagaceae bacterium]